MNTFGIGPGVSLNSIDRSLPVAAYFQIAHDLKIRLDSGEWNTTKRLPSETKLASEYGVSRMTVRQAMAELETEGLVERRQGAGTFVGAAAPSHGRVTVTMSETLSVSQALKDMGYDPVVKLVRSTAMPVPTEEIARALNLGAGDLVAHFQRNFEVEGRCVVVTNSFLPYHLVEGILDQPLENDSVQLTLLHRYGIRDERNQRWIEAVRATDDEAATLNIEIGSPLMMMTSLFSDYKSQPIDYMRTIWPGDAIRLYLEQRVGFSN